MKTFNFKEYCRLQFAKTNDSIKLLKNVITNIKNKADYLPSTSIGAYGADNIPDMTWVDDNDVTW